MTKQEFLKKLTAMARVAGKLPEGVDILHGTISPDYEVGTCIQLFSGIEEAPKLAGRDTIRGKRIDGKRMELSFRLENVRVFQIMGENEVRNG